MTGQVPDFSIHELHLPESLDGLDGKVFRELSSVMDAMVLETWGNLERASSAQARLAGWRDTPYAVSRHVFARVDGRIIGHASCEVPLKDNIQTAWLEVDVLEGYRRYGIGTALLRTVEGIAKAQGRHVLQAHTEHPIGLAGAEGVPGEYPTLLREQPSASRTVTPWNRPADSARWTWTTTRNGQGWSLRRTPKQTPITGSLPGRTVAPPNTWTAWPG
ncbi:hypothetical protein AHiyo8_50470 [Arthrobacter sp. Hiyo8]|nr:hypothetical protein AHiyo8_50470 [Arthrobacter sp. Hiyo8]